MVPLVGGQLAGRGFDRGLDNLDGALVRGRGNVKLESNVRLESLDGRRLLSGCVRLEFGALNT